MKNVLILALLAVIMAGCIENGYKVEKSSKVFVDITYDRCESLRK